MEHSLFGLRSKILGALVIIVAPLVVLTMYRQRAADTVLHTSRVVGQHSLPMLAELVRLQGALTEVVLALSEDRRNESTISMAVSEVEICQSIIAQLRTEASASADENQQFLELASIAGHLMEIA